MASIIVYPEEVPRIIEVLAPADEVTIQELVNLCREWEQSYEGMAYPQIIQASGKEDLGGSVSVGITAKLLNAQLMFTGRTTPINGGACTTGDSSGKILIDAGGHFITDGLYPGCTVFNATTSAMATVSRVVSETELRSFRLSGGANAEWHVLDQYAVYPNVQCSISGGNLVASDDIGATISPVLQSPNVQVVRTSSASATLQELSAIQYASFNGGVTVDELNGSEGTEFPIGTQETPVKYFTDALVIAQSRGFFTFYIRGSCTVNTGRDFSAGYRFEGQSPALTRIYVNNNANVSNCEFVNCFLDGILDGDTYIQHCTIGDLHYVNGQIQDCAFTGTVELAGARRTSIYGCYSNVNPTTYPVIDMGTSGQDLSLKGYSGLLKITNLSADNFISIDLDSGKMLLDSTLSNGVINVRGVGLCVDETTGSALVNVDGLISKEATALAVVEETGQAWSIVYVDTIHGVAGSEFPKGTRAYPINNLIDAMLVADSRGIKEIDFIGELTLDRSFVGFTFRGMGGILDSVINLNNKSLDLILFHHCIVRGIQNAVPYAGGETWSHAVRVEYRDCYLEYIDGLEGIAEHCQIEGLTKIKPGGWFSSIETVIDGDYTVFDMGSTESTVVSMDVNSGWTQFINTVEGTLIELNVKGGEVSFYDSCLGGDYYLEGTGTLFNEGFMTVKENHFNWDELMEYHPVSGSFGEQVWKKILTVPKFLGLK